MKQRTETWLLVEVTTKEEIQKVFGEEGTLYYSLLLVFLVFSYVVIIYHFTLHII